MLKEEQVEQIEVSNYKNLVKGQTYTVKHFAENRATLTMNTGKVVFIGIETTKRAMFKTDDDPTLPIVASVPTNEMGDKYYISRDTDVELPKRRVANSKAMYYHATDDGPYAGLHCYMYVWMDENPTATWEEYVRKGKTLGIATYNEETYYEKDYPADV
jgi:hypothetical protein